MTTDKKSFIGLSVAAALSFTLASCSTPPPTEPQSVSSITVLDLPKPWDESKAKWSVSGVEDIVALPKNIAVTSTKRDPAKKNEDREFTMYSPEGKVIAHLGRPSEFESDEYNHISMETTHVNGKMYIVVTQSNFDRFSSHDEVVTGFDEDGNQTFRKHAEVESDKFLPDLDPVTGEIVPKVEVFYEGTRAIDFQGFFDGVPLNQIADPENLKMFLAGDGWEREIPVGASIMKVGAYAAIERIYDNSDDKDSHLMFNGGKPYCQIIDPHTGKDVVDEDAVSTSCMLDGRLNSANRYDSAYISFKAPSSLDNRLITNAVLLPESGKSRDLSFAQHFTPYSVDSDGTIYGLLTTDKGELPASTSIDSSDYPVIMNDAERVPVALTGSGIAAFPVEGADYVIGAPTFNHDRTTILFAVK